MKLRTIREQSCDRIECTYNRYYKGSFIEFFPVSDISEKVVIRFLSDIVVGLGGVSYKEFGRIYQVINNVLVYAKDMQLGGARLLDWSMIKRYVPEGSLLPDGHQYFAVPRADVEKMLQLVLVRRIYPLKQSACMCLMLNFYLGLRVGELASLTWQDIDLRRRMVRIHKTEIKSCSRDEEGNRCSTMTYKVVEDVKTYSSFREVPLLPEAVYIIRKLQQHHRRCRYQSIFLAYDGKECILVRSLDRTLRRLCTLCGVNYFSSHCIRKTFATMLSAAGMPTRYIADLLGHSDMRVTERNYILTYKDVQEEYLPFMRQGLSFGLPMK